MEIYICQFINFSSWKCGVWIFALAFNRMPISLSLFPFLVVCTRNALHRTQPNNNNNNHVYRAIEPKIYLWINDEWQADNVHKRWVGGAGGNVRLLQNAERRPRSGNCIRCAQRYSACCTQNFNRQRHCRGTQRIVSIFFSHSLSFCCGFGACFFLHEYSTG